VVVRRPVSHLEIAGGKRIYQHLSEQAALGRSPVGIWLIRFSWYHTSTMIPSRSADHTREEVLRNIGKLSRCRARKLWLCILFLGCTPKHAAAQLIEDKFGAYVPYHHEVRDVFFYDSQFGWIVVQNHDNDRSYIFATNDGGRTWAQHEAPHELLRVRFLTPTLGWALRAQRSVTRDGSSIYLLTSLDGGVRWKALSSKPITPMRSGGTDIVLSFAFIDPMHGWFAGGRGNNLGLVLETSDGGKSVHVLQNPSDRIGSCLGVIARPDIGIWVYGAGAVLYSANHGKSWESLDLEKLGTNSENFDIADAFFAREGRGWLVGHIEEAGVLATHDRGNSWRAVFASDMLALNAVSFSNDNRGCAVGNSTKLVCTSDGGSTWSATDVLPPQEKGQPTEFYQIKLLDSGRGWLTSIDGHLYET
jgi:photosystem II stability/assembly factor-like uncharacterized protein